MLHRTSTFVRVAKKLLRKKPHLVNDVAAALAQLEADPHHPFLKTHKLVGCLDGSFACSAGYDLRIIFSFVKYEDKEVILLETIGTHDDVY